MSTSTLILPKIVPPRPGGGIIARQRLIARLQSARESKVVLLTGAAGFGKTTLMAQWHQLLAQAGVRVVWLTLAAGDGALARFGAILGGALLRAGVPIDMARDTALRDGTCPHEAAALLLDALARVPGDSYLMVDDFHHVCDPAAVALVQAMAEAVLPGLHLVIASRTMPALRLGRLQAMDELTVLDCADLPFDLDETAAFLKARPGVRPSAGAVRHVHDLTDGWPAGVRLASRALAAGRSGSVPTRAEICGGGSLDAYLSEEVIDQLPAELLDFMLRVSVLRCFQAELAGCATGCADPEQWIAQLNARHGLLQPVDRRDGKRWYRFHPILASYLDKRRARGGIDGRPLHRRAAHWFMQQGRFAEAMRSAVLSDDLDMVAQLVDRALPPPHSLAQFGVIARWIEGVGAERLAGHPRLLRLGAWACALTGRSELAGRWLLALEAACAAGAHPAHARHLLLLKAMVATHRDDGEAALAALRALEAIGAPAAPGALDDVEVALRMRWLAALGRHAQARALYNAPAARNTRTGRGELALVAAAMAASVALREGNAPEAERIASTALRRAQDIHGGRSLCAAVCAAVTAQAWYELDRIDEAHEALLYCGKTLRASSPELKLRAAQTLGRIKALREAPRDALAYFCRAEAHFRSGGVSRGAACMVAEQQRIVLSYGDWRHAQDLQAVLEDLAASEINDQPGALEIQAVTALSRMQLRLAQRLPHEAMDMLEPLRCLAVSTGCGRMTAITDLLEVRALTATGQHAKALLCAHTALAACYRLGLHRTLIEEGWPVRDTLLQAASLAGGKLYDYARGLLGERGLNTAESVVRHKAPAGVPASELAPVLTRRELEVLALLEQSMSNKRIALTLNISVQTVKWNLKKIFVKLQVTSRYEAIIAARKLSLCDH